MRTSLHILSIVFSLAAVLAAQDKSPIAAPTDPARVFITDSESWSVAGGGGGSHGSYGSSSSGGARPQTAEIIKTFGERCPQVKVNNIQQKTDYVVVLDHEGGKSFLAHRNKVAVFGRVSGDSVMSKSTLSLGASVQAACEAIAQDWSEHGVSIRAEAAEADQPKAVPVEAAPPPPAAAPVPVASVTAKLQIDSTPTGADIEIDGSFVGSTPSEIQVADGDHSVVVKKSGFKEWNRKMKATAGSSVHVHAELEKVDNP